MYILQQTAAAPKSKTNRGENVAPKQQPAVKYVDQYGNTVSPLTPSGQTTTNIP